MIILNVTGRITSKIIYYISTGSTSRRVFQVFNFTLDFLNYFIFVLIHHAIDIYMLVRLRNTLKEKYESMIEMNKKGRELKEAMNNAVRISDRYYSITFCNHTIYNRSTKSNFSFWFCAFYSKIRNRNELYAVVPEIFEWLITLQLTLSAFYLRTFW